MRLAVLVSGSGTNLQALLDAEHRGELAPGEIVLVASNRPSVQALERAQGAGKPAIVVDHKRFPSREAFEEGLLETLSEHRVDAVVLAGFMRVLTPLFLGRFPDRIVNIHPSLLPAFPGVDAQRQAWEHGVKVAGCTVHFVSPELDEGAIILQASVPVPDAVGLSSEEGAARLRARILEKEHEILPAAVQLLAAGRLLRQGRRVRILPPK
ncbi:MAG: phosphoribosylglycinamide formyltransferase [Deltaproteobacteria bacterium]|nr:phosphoribosylglycinamide formyltransferase [Deltaproteobacteria bacterium]